MSEMKNSEKLLEMWKKEEPQKIKLNWGIDWSRDHTFIPPPEMETIFTQTENGITVTIQDAPHFGITGGNGPVVWKFVDKPNMASGTRWGSPVIRDDMVDAMAMAFYRWSPPPFVTVTEVSPVTTRMEVTM